MNDEYPERSSRGLINLLLIIVIIAGVVAAMWKVGVFDTDTEVESINVTSTEKRSSSQTDDNFQVSQSDWNTLQSQLKQLQKDVKTLQKEVNTLKQNKPTTTNSTVSSSSTQKTSTTTSPSSTISGTASHANAISLIKYSHDGDNYEAALTFKNNTDKTIMSFKGRLVYLDMNGEMLNYIDINQSISIDPSYVKIVKLKGYEWDKGYSYYKSPASRLYPNRKYQVRFELKSYKN